MPTSARSPTILLIDDDADTRYLFESALAEEGYRILQAPNGFGGVELALQDQVDIVLLDVMLPDIDGFECCHQLTERLAENCPPILMITGLDDEVSINRAFEAEVTDFIPKPVNIPVLINRIKRVLRERELVQRLESVNSQLLKASQTDGLTKIANRHYFQMFLRREWSRLAREQKPLAILLCDLDAFKQYNDSHGHLAGDVCLQQFATVLNASVNRATDLAARYGGEEFILLLPNTSVEGLRTVDDRIRRRLAEKALPHDSSWVDKFVTYSAGGVSAVPRLDRNPDSLIERADQALYQAKDRGRNRTIIDPSHASPTWHIG